MNGELQIQKSQLLMFESEDGKFHIDVRFEDETVWLTQALMSELLTCTPENILVHIRNIYGEGELLPEATTKDFLVVRQEGNRQVQRLLKFYNLAQEEHEQSLLELEQGFEAIILLKKHKYSQLIDMQIIEKAINN